jgi:hypothetical protein
MYVSETTRAFFKEFSRSDEQFFFIVYNNNMIIGFHINFA